MRMWLVMPLRLPCGLAPEKGAVAAEGADANRKRSRAVVAWRSILLTESVSGRQDPAPMSTIAYR